MIELQGSTAGSIFMAPKDYFSILDFGAKGDGTTDDTTAIQKAISAAGTKGGIVFFPANTYLISSTLILPANVILMGAGMNATKIEPTASFTGDVVQFSGVGCGVSSVRFDSAAQRTGGAYINTAENGSNFGIDCVVEKVYFNNGYDTIMANYSTRCYFRELSIYNYKNSAVTVGNLGATNDIYFETIVSDNSPTAQPPQAVLLTAPATGLGANGIVFTNTDFIHGGTPLKIHAPAGGTVEWLFFHGFMGDTCSGDALSMDGLGTIQGIVFTNSWFSTASNNGAEINTGSGISFTGCRFLNSTNTGITLQPAVTNVGTGASNVTMTGCLFAGNNQGARTGTDVSGAGINIGSGVSDVTVTGCISSQWGSYGNTQTVGLAIQANCTKISVAGNDFSTNKTQAILNNGDAGNLIVDQQFGFTSSTFGAVGGRVKLSTVDGGNNLWFTTGRSTEPGNLAFGWVTDINGNVTQINMKQPTTFSSYVTVGNVAALPTASATYRGQIILVLGNGTTTADTFYICLESATGTYSWKSIIAG